jgi:hypothetical protein
MNRAIMGLLGVAGLVLVLGGCAGSGAPLQEKCFWQFGGQRRTHTDADNEVRLVKSLGFNALVVAPRGNYPQYLIARAHQEGLKVYLMHNAVYGGWDWWEFPGAAAPKMALQEYPNQENEQLDHPVRADEVAYSGPWICIDRPEGRQYGADLAKAILKAYPGADGLAVDFVGYKNHLSCRCAYSETERAAFARGHTDLSPGEVAREYSLASLMGYYETVRAAAKEIDPKAAILCHVYPPFDAEPMYGNRLAVDYPAQTVAWFFAPHEDLKTVKERCDTVARTEYQYHPYVTGTAFIGLDPGAPHAKSPQRVREELRLVKEAGLKGLCVAGGAALLQDAAVCDAISEELGGTYHRSRPVIKAEPVVPATRSGQTAATRLAGPVRPTTRPGG